MWKQKYYEDLYHHGIKGQKWGHRRFQNKDGSLTPAGKKRYDDSDGDKSSVDAKVINTSSQNQISGKTQEHTPAKSRREEAWDTYKKKDADLNAEVKNIQTTRNKKIDEIRSQYKDSNGEIRDPEALARMRKINAEADASLHEIRDKRDSNHNDYFDTIDRLETEAYKSDPSTAQPSNSTMSNLPVPIVDKGRHLVEKQVSSDTSKNTKNPTNSKPKAAADGSEPPISSDNLGVRLRNTDSPLQRVSADKFTYKDDKGNDVDITLKPSESKTKDASKNTKKPEKTLKEIQKEAKEKQKKEEVAVEKRKKEEEAAAKKKEQEEKNAAQKREREEKEAARKKKEEEVAVEKRKKEEEAAAKKKEQEEAAAQQYKRTTKRLQDIHNMNQDTDRLVKGGSDLVDVFEAGRKRRAMRNSDAGTLSDSELQRRISRMSMENTYNSMKYGQTSRGAEAVKGVLKGIGATVSTVSAVAGLALTIRRLLEK